MGLFGWFKGKRPAGEAGDSGLFSRMHADSQETKQSPYENYDSPTLRMDDDPETVAAPGDEEAATTGQGGSGFANSQTVAPQHAGRFSFRKNLVQMVLREVLDKAGIPPHWIRAEVLVVSSRSRASAVHVRFVMAHWDDRLLFYATTLQRKFQLRILAMDPMAPEWLSGISWQFPDDESIEFPELPPASRWLARPGPEA